MQKINSLEAIKLYKRLALKKRNMIAIQLYSIYLNKRYVPRDENEANKWLNIAAENGSLLAKTIIRENSRSYSSDTNGSNTTINAANCDWCGNTFSNDGYGKSGDVDHLNPVQTDHPKLTSLSHSKKVALIC